MTSHSHGKHSWALGFFLLLLTSACHGTPVSPTHLPTPTPAPSPGPSTQTPPKVPPVTNNSDASVTAEDSFAIVRPSGSGFGYEVRFLLREISGRSGATINRIVVYGPTGTDETGAGCWREKLRVPPMGSLDTFHTEEGSNWLLYCGPGSAGTTASPVLHVIVTFTDDFGVAGSISFPIASLR